MFIMIRFERACSRLIGKWLFSQDYLSPDLLFLILLFCLILTCLILLKKKEDFSSPPESIISIFSCLSAIFMAVLASGPSVVQAMDHPPVRGSPSEAGPSGSAAGNPGPSADRGEPSSAPLPGGQPEFGDNSAPSTPPSRPVSPSDLRAMEELFRIEEKLKPIIRGMHRELDARHVGELQAVHLIDDLVERHGAEHMPEILRSFRDKGASSPYFQGLYNDFMNLRATKGTEDNLHKEYMGLKVFRGSRRGGH